MRLKFKSTLLFIFLFLFLVSCGGSKKVSSSRKKTHTTTSKKTAATSSKKSSKKTIKVSENKTSLNIIKTAKTFEGTRYKFGGTTKKGMDCSGLVYVAYKKEGITLPRVSRDMAKTGKSISLKKVAKGDLLFFITSKSKNRINHVALVTKVSNGTIYFIHSTTSRGVITSSLEESYWKKTFVAARRII